MAVRRLVASLVVASLLVAVPAVAEESVGRALLKLGGEYDTNARRTVGSERVGDEVARVFAKIEVDAWLGAAGNLATKAMLGAKVHRAVRDEDAFITSLSISWSRGLWRLADALRLSGFARGDFGDRAERASSRDYLRGGAVGGLRAGGDAWWTSLGAGSRFFVYKPDLSSNHTGATVEASAGLRFADGFSAGVDYAWIDRSFEDARFVEQAQLVSLDPTTRRRDVLHVLRVELRHVGAWLVAASYALQLNRSNSFGPGLVRHVGEASWTQPLPWGLMVSVSGRLQRTEYDDPVRLDQTLQLDDENRNHVVAALLVPVAGPLELELRYSLYAEAHGDLGDFVRQLVYFGLTADFDALLE